MTVLSSAACACVRCEIAAHVLGATRTGWRFRFLPYERCATAGPGWRMSSAGSLGRCLCRPRQLEQHANSVLIGAELSVAQALVEPTRGVVGGNTEAKPS